MGRPTRIGSIKVGKTLAHATLIDLRETDGVRFMTPSGSDLDGKTIMVFEYPTGDDGNVDESEAFEAFNRTEQISFVAAAGRGVPLDEWGNVCHFVRLVCADATANQTPIRIAGKAIPNRP